MHNSGKGDTPTSDRHERDRRLFVLNNRQWKKFQAFLDRPAIHKPRLAKLLTSKSVFD
jgi:uncharacterized protein (DUF1778 family)